MLVWDRNWVVVEQDPPAGTIGMEYLVQLPCSTF
jgi:hypothetical protein